MLLLCKETIVQSLSQSYVYIFTVETFDYVDNMSLSRTFFFFYDECCFWLFKGIGFYFYDYITYSTSSIFAFCVPQIKMGLVCVLSFLVVICF